MDQFYVGRYGYYPGPIGLPATLPENTPTYYFQPKSSATSIYLLHRTAGHSAYLAASIPGAATWPPVSAFGPLRGHHGCFAWLRPIAAFGPLRGHHGFTAPLLLRLASANCCFRPSYGPPRLYRHITRLLLLLLSALLRATTSYHQPLLASFNCDYLASVSHKPHITPASA